MPRRVILTSGFFASESADRPMQPSLIFLSHRHLDCDIVHPAASTRPITTIRDYLILYVSFFRFEILMFLSNPT